MKLNRPSRSWHDHDLNGRLRHGRSEPRRPATTEPSLSGTLEAYTPPSPLDEPVEAHIVDASTPTSLSTVFETEPAEQLVHETQAYEPNPFTAPLVAEPAADPWTPELPATPVADVPPAPLAPVFTPAPVAATAPMTPAPVTPAPEPVAAPSVAPTAPGDDVFALLLERLHESQAGVEVLLGASVEAVAAARDEVAQHRAHAEAEAAAIVAQAHAEAERIRADALADVEDARRRLARFSAEIESLAGELHDRHLG